VSDSPVAYAKAWRALVKILLPAFDIVSNSSSIGGNHVCEYSPQLLLFCGQIGFFSLGKDLE